MTRLARRQRLIAMVHSLPEARADIDGDQNQHLSLGVRGKRFGWYLDDHHGDGQVALTCKAPPGLNEELVARESDRFFLPAYTGPKGWVGLRLDLETVDWDDAEHLLLDAYRMTAPKSLIALLADRGRGQSGRESPA